MKYEIKKDPHLGSLLWMTDGNTEIAATLDVGIRIIHLSACGMENLFYRQPEDLSDGLCKREGWRIIGGHRLWLAPESEKSYYPDREPVSYALGENAVVLTQTPDPWLGIRKSIRLEFLPDGRIKVQWRAENLGEEAIVCALWGIHTLQGGIGTVGFSRPGWEPYRPSRTIGLWRDTNLGDERIRFTDNGIAVKHKPGESYFKIGFYSQEGRMHHENLGQSFDIEFPVFPPEQCPDGGSNVEIWMGRFCLELEALGPLTRLEPQGSTGMEVFWNVKPLGL